MKIFTLIPSLEEKKAPVIRKKTVISTHALLLFFHLKTQNFFFQLIFLGFQKHGPDIHLLFFSCSSSGSYRGHCLKTHQVNLSSSKAGKAEKLKRAVDTGRTDERQAKARRTERTDNSRGQAVYMSYTYTTSHRRAENYMRIHSHSTHTERAL